LVARHWSACQRKQQHLAMACVSTVASTSDVPQAVMSQRLGDLLLQFPSAAIGGVQWCVLARKYEERFSARLDARSLGHTSALSLATTLLWDVARLVDVTDTDNPILALEDGVALSPQPGCIGSWPSLYSSLCTIVQNNGADELQATQATAVSRHAGRSLLLSRVKPLLQAHWHAHFDEASFSYWNEQGATVKVKKLKHLITAVLRWRSERLTWLLEEGRKPSTLDRALLVKLELAPASCQNDLLLSCVQDERAMEEMLKSPGTGVRLRRELSFAEQGQAPPPSVHELFDDPFEPPPQKLDRWPSSLLTPTGSDRGFWSGVSSPLFTSARANFEMDSADSTQSTMTPTSELEENMGFMPTNQQGACAVVPVWFSYLPTALFGDRGDIPSGIVDRLRSKFEPSSSSFTPPASWQSASQ